MVPKIEPISAQLPPLNFLIYADSGAGKTVFSGSANRVLFIAPEDSGLLSAAMTGSKADKIKIRNWGDFVEAYEWCYDNQFDLAEKYDWLAIDSATAMQAMCMRAISEDERAKRISRDQDPDVPQIQDYQKLYILMEKMVLAFNDLAINVIYTALARNVENNAGEEFMMPMLGSNKPTDYRVAMQIAAHMTSYGYLNVEVVDKPKDPTKPDGDKKKVKQRVIYWDTTEDYAGKDRTTRLAPKTVLPARNALQFVTRIARGEIDRDGKPLSVAKPAVKKAPAKRAVKVEEMPIAQSKVAPHSNIPVEPGLPAIDHNKEAEDRLNRNPEAKEMIDEAIKEMENGETEVEVDIDSVEA